MIEEKLERLAAAGIEIVPLAGVSHHLVLARDGFAALVERKEDGFGAIGAPGLATERGFAVLVWRGERAFFVLRGFEAEATPEQVDGLRRFGHDLEQALSR